MSKNDPSNGITMLSPSNSSEFDDLASLSQRGPGALSKGDSCQPVSKFPGALGSVFVQLCLILSALCLTFMLYPGRLDSADAVQPELRHYVTKVASFLSSSEKPEIVILGSSLMLCPASLCDLEIEAKKPLDHQWFAARFVPEYKHARYFEKLLNSKSDRSCQIVNLAVAASLMSDHGLLLDSIVAADKHPQLVICGIAPRDFIDNNQPDLALTPVHKLLSDIRPELLSSEANPSLDAFCNRQALKVRRAITCLSLGANRFFCQLARRPDNDNAAKLVPGMITLPATKAKDLAVYKKLYNPFSEQRLIQQSVYLEHMLQAANKNHIKVLLVSMPITAENLELLPAPALAAYNQTIKKIAAKHQVTLLDLQRSPSFGADDFSDSCHLNASGGAKFYGQLVRATEATLASGP